MASGGVCNLETVEMQWFCWKRIEVAYDIRVTVHVTRVVEDK